MHFYHLCIHAGIWIPLERDSDHVGSSYSQTTVSPEHFVVIFQHLKVLPQVEFYTYHVTQLRQPSYHMYLTVHC